MPFSISSPPGSRSRKGLTQTAMPGLEVPAPEEPPTPAVPDVPVTPIDPDPGTPGAPESPATVPTPSEPATPVVPEPRPGSPEPDPHPDPPPNLASGEQTARERRTGGPMIDLEERLVTYIDDAHGLEQHMRRALDGLIERTNDPEIQGVLRHHKEETDRHRQRLAERLAAHDATPSTVKDAGQIFVALTKEIIDRARPGSGGKIFSDGCVAEHLEITSYDEEAMVAELRAGWDQRLQA